MQMEQGDVDAIDARIERAMRAASAAAIRMQATSLGSMADSLLAQSRVLTAFADDIEAGRADPPARPVRLAVVPEEPEEREPAGSDEEVEAAMRRVQPLVRRDDGSIDATGDVPLWPAMVEFIGRFDDRILQSRWFVTAVNEAAEAGREANEQTARLVGARVRELVG